MPVNMTQTIPYQGRDGKMYPVPNWQSLGFLVPPTLSAAGGTERLFRVWTTAEKRPGRFFSFHAYRTRREAEAHSNVMQYGNGILGQSEYSVQKGTPLWIGKVHPGDFAERFGYKAGSQIFIDFEFLDGALTKIRDVPILDDMNGAVVINNPDIPDNRGKRPLNS